MGKRSVKTAIWLGAASALALSVAAASAETRLRMMHQGDPDYVAAYKGVAQRYEAANPDVKIELISTPHDSYNERVGVAALAKDLPDIMEIDAPFVANYVWSGFLRPISDYIDPKIISNMTSSDVSQGTYPVDNKLYALGLIDSTVMLYGNKKFLEAAGVRIPKGVDDAWTKDEFEDALAKLSKVEGVQWPLDIFRSYGSKSEWLTYAYSPILQSYGCDLIDRKTWKATGTLDSEPCVQAMAEMQSWFKKDWVVPQSAGGNQFYAEGGKVGLAWGGHWFWKEASANLKDNVVVMPLPKFGEKEVSPNGTWIWGITTKSEHPEEAGKFLSFMMQDKEMREFFKSYAAVPGLKDFSAESPLYTPGGALAVGAEQAEKTALPRPPHPAYPTITLATMVAMDAIFSGADPQEELTKAAEKIDADIEDNDGYPPFNGE